MRLASRIVAEEGRRKVGAEARKGMPAQGTVRVQAARLGTMRRGRDSCTCSLGIDGGTAGRTTRVRVHSAKIRLAIFCGVLMLFPSAEGQSVSSDDIEKGGYPANAMWCYSTMTKPYGIDEENSNSERGLLCPEARNQFCVKEVSSTPRELCGKTLYFGDEWDELRGQCIYKKCADVCEETRIYYEHAEVEYFRDIYCCKTGRQDGAPCNDAPGRHGSVWITASFAILSLCLVLLQA
mmetsp:Transcript_36877/g.115448  ORF Transcript_36877/g.115448 Transcript_36877/m.115448 type:complete len:237 (-) Transcript_36877:137-847(-)